MCESGGWRVENRDRSKAQGNRPGLSCAVSVTAGFFKYHTPKTGGHSFFTTSEDCMECEPEERREETHAWLLFQVAADQKWFECLFHNMTVYMRGLKKTSFIDGGEKKKKQKREM